MLLPQIEFLPFTSGKRRGCIRGKRCLRKRWDKKLNSNPNLAQQTENLVPLLKGCLFDPLKGNDAQKRITFAIKVNVHTIAVSMHRQRELTSRRWSKKEKSHEKLVSLCFTPRFRSTNLINFNLSILNLRTFAEELQSLPNPSSTLMTFLARHSIKECSIGRKFA